MVRRLISGKSRSFLVLFACLLLAGLTPSHHASAQAQLQPITADEILQTMRDGNPVSLDKREIVDTLDFTKLAAESEDVADIKGSLTITRSTFDKPVVALTQDAKKSRKTVRFEGNVDFTNAVFSASVIFARAVFASDASFQDAHFADSNFSNAQFIGLANFSGAEMTLPSTFIGTQFKGDALFIVGATGKTKFDSGAFFNLAQFTGAAIFTDATFEGGSTIYDEASFGGSADFSKVHFSNASFQKTHFSDNANFVSAVFSREASFSNANFEKTTSFHRAQFDNVTFLGAAFTLIDLSRITYAPGHLNLLETRYSALRLSDDFDFDSLQPLDDPDQFVDMLKNLEVALRTEGVFVAANNAAYKRQVLARINEPSVVFKAAEYSLVEIPFGYYLRPERPLFFSLLIIFICAVFYYPRDAIRYRHPDKAPSHEQKLTLRLTELPVAAPNEFSPQSEPETSPSLPPNLWARLWHSLWSRPSVQKAWLAFGFSFSVFTKISYGNRVATSWRSVVVVIEWILGYYMLAGLVYTILNTLPLLQPLIKPF